MKIFLREDAPEWHIKWMLYQIAQYRRDRQLPNLDPIDPNNRMQAMPFVDYLREKGYDAWRHIPLEGDDYIFVNVTPEEYLFEQLRATL